MNTQQQEAQDYEASYDRFEGFDVGDRNNRNADDYSDDAEWKQARKGYQNDDQADQDERRYAEA